MEINLFRDGSLAQYLRQRETRALESVNTVPLQRLLDAADLSALASELAGLHTVRVPVLDEEHKTMTDEEPESAGGRHAGLVGWSGQGRSLGGTYRFFVPFTGDPAIFRYQPSQYQGGAIPRGEVRENDLVFTYPSDAGVEAIQQALNSTLAKIRFCLTAATSDVRNHNEALPGLLRQALVARKAEAEGRKRAADQFGIPRRG